MLATDSKNRAQRSSGITRTVNAGLKHHQAGRLERAEALYRKVLTKDPAHPQALHLFGVIAYQRGQNAFAIALIERALPSLQDVADAHLNLGNALLAAGRAADAAGSYRRAVELQSDHGLAHSNLGRALNEQKEYEAGLESSRHATELIPDFAGAHLNCGNALMGLGRYAEAEAPLRCAMNLQPDSAEICDALGSALTELQRFDEALRWRDRAIELNPNHPSWHQGRAVTLFRMCDLERSEAEFRLAHSLAPNNVEPLVGLGHVLSLLGRYADANQNYRHALELAPGLPQAYLGFAEAGEQVSQDLQIEVMTTILANQAAPVLSRVDAGFAAGMLLDKADRYDEAFPCFAQANALYREYRAKRGERYDPDHIQREVDRLIVRCTMEGLAQGAIGGHSSELPVFIVGMPRSGTSLIEQIAASHSRVFGAGELRDLDRIVKATQAQHSDNAMGDRSLGRELAAEHLARLQALGGSAVRVIDKMPDNIFLVGPIAVLFPAARVIICRRDICDTCLSCYFQRFAEENWWSYDLTDCRHRALQVERLADHWLRVLPNKVMEIVYEDVVADLEGESRRLVEFLGLEWEAGCLEFHKTERPVLTASHWQVRQPLYSRSVGRWRHYERHLGPLLEGLPPQ